MSGDIIMQLILSSSFNLNCSCCAHLPNSPGVTFLNPFFFTHQNSITMEKQIQVQVELTIADGKVEELQSQMPAIIEKVKANEPDIAGYQWYLSGDQTKCYIMEWFNNPQAWLTHLSNVGPALPALFAIAPITRFEAFGDIPEEIETAVKPLGAVIHRYLSGFIRL